MLLLAFILHDENNNSGLHGRSGPQTARSDRMAFIVRTVCKIGFRRAEPSAVQSDVLRRSFYVVDLDHKPKS